MKKAILSVLCLLPLLAFAQAPFTVKGTGPGFREGDKIYLTYKADGRVITDSAVVANHTFIMKGDVVGQIPATLYQNENPMVIDVSHNSHGLYIEPGNIVITSPDSLMRAIVSGTSTNADMMALSAIMKPLQAEYLKLVSGFEALNAEQQKDITTVANFRRKRQALLSQMEPVKYAFIKAHPASYVSLVAVGELKRFDAPVALVASAFNLLTPAVKETPVGKKLSGDIAAAIKADNGMVAADFTLPNPQGKPVKLSGFKGKYVLIDFWASWCAPCRAENPFIIQAYQKYKDKGFAILGVSLDDQSSRKAWLKAIKDDGLTWSQVSDLKGWKNKAALLYGVTTIPANFLVDPAGKVVARDIKDKTLDDTLARLLSGK
jgi:thiol-disulfide isomerase/thioredoxin